jgi:hypothetical protein
MVELNSKQAKKNEEKSDYSSVENKLRFNENLDRISSVKS